MKRNISLNDITDGRLYHKNDMVKIGCDDCRGCSACCRNMEALVLDPYDIDQISKELTADFERLLETSIIITEVDGLLLPVMNTQGEGGKCFYLDEDGRCSIHAFRPGICRLFPLGRYYHDQTFSYVLQVKECQKERTTKVKVKSWLGIDNLFRYESYVLQWHDFLADIRGQLSLITPEEQRILHMYLLRSFYQMNYGSDFYKAFSRRLKKARQDLGLTASTFH